MTSESRKTGFYGFWIKIGKVLKFKGNDYYNTMAATFWSKEQKIISPGGNHTLYP